MALELSPDLRVNDRVTLTLVPPECGAGNVHSYIYGPFVGLSHEGWGTVILRPDEALMVAEWLLEHRQRVLALQETQEMQAKDTPEDHLAGATPEQVKRVHDVLTGRVRVCPECGGRLLRQEDTDDWYCPDRSCLWPWKSSEGSEDGH